MILFHVALAFGLFVVAVVAAFWGIRALWLSIKKGPRSR
jgi:hypothetical protein